MGVRMGVPEGKHAVEASDEARVAVMSCGLNRAGGGRPPFRATRASVRKISPLVRRAGYAYQKFPSESAFPFLFQPDAFEISIAVPDCGIVRLDRLAVIGTLPFLFFASHADDILVQHGHGSDRQLRTAPVAVFFTEKRVLHFSVPFVYRSPENRAPCLCSVFQAQTFAS